MSGKTKTEPQPVDRRGFLKALGLGAGAVATTAVAVAPVEAIAGESDAEKKKGRYKETEHVKAFYRTSRY
jgi:hypothetical protein